MSAIARVPWGQEVFPNEITRQTMYETVKNMDIGLKIFSLRIDSVASIVAIFASIVTVPKLIEGFQSLAN